MRCSRNRFSTRPLAWLACAAVLLAGAEVRAASLAWSTYLGGTQSDQVTAATRDAAGNAYVCGDTGSSDFPGGDPNAGKTDVFVSKLSADGASVLWTTMLAGSDLEGCTGIAVDAGGQVYVTGDTQSQDFPGTANAIAPSFSGPLGVRVYLAKLAANGDLLYSTSLGLGGSGRVALDGSANAYVLAHRQVQGDPCTYFVEKIDTTASGSAGQLYLKCFELNGLDDLAVDPGGIAFIAGTVGATTTPPTTPGAFQETCSATSLHNTFVMRLSADGSSIEHATCLSAPCLAEGKLPGGISAASIALDPSDNVYLAGETTCSDFPVTAGAYDSTYNGPFSLVPLMFGDVYLARFDASLSSLTYATFLGGSWMDHPRAVTVDDFGSAYLVGQAQEADFPTVFVPQLGTCPGHFFAEIDTSVAGQNALSYSTCLDGAFPAGVKVDGAGLFAVLGGEAMTGLTTTAGSFQPALAGDMDGFVMKLQVHSAVQVSNKLQGFLVMVAPKLPPGLASTMSSELDRMNRAIERGDLSGATHWLQVVDAQARPLIRRGALSAAESRTLEDVLDAEALYLASRSGGTEPPR